MNIRIPDEVEKILNTLNENGYEAYVVGGCVRDSFLGKEPKDWDICTSALPELTMKCFVEEKIIETGLKHGTITIMINGKPFEVTTYRKDGVYSDNRHPDNVEFVNDIKEDLSRRDFTINAMAYNPAKGAKDYFGGWYDLKHGIIRCVGNPIDRFNEDALRVMRAIRFAVNLDFELTKETVEAIWDCGHNLKNVSQERKHDELIKILTGIQKLKKDSPHYFKTRGMVEYIIKIIIPEFQDLAQVAHNNPYHYTDVFNHTMDMLFMADTDDIELLLAVLFHDIGKMKAKVFDERRLTNHYYGHAVYSIEIAKEIMERLKFDNKTIETVLRLVEAHDFIIQVHRKCAKKLLNKLGHELCLKLLRFQLLDKKAHRWNSQHEYQEWASEVVEIQNLWNEILENNEAFKISDLVINGYDLMEIGFAQGKKLGEVLEKCLEYVIDNPDRNNKEDLINYVKIEGI